MDNLDSLSTDEKYMAMALELAKKGGRAVAPNPMVGAIIVNNGQVIGQGGHLVYGGPHAEVNALNSAKNRDLIKGSTVYVTLEPCQHHGKTPPCLDLLQREGVSKIVCGSRDPFQKKMPKIANIKIEFLNGKIAKECELLNKYFFKWITKKTPFITVKVAVSNDGFVAGINGQPVHITNDKQDKEVHMLRSLNQAILVGSNTVINDNPMLNVRHIVGHNPLRILIDSHHRIPKNSNVFNDNNYLLATLSPSQFHPVKNIWISPTKKKVSLKKLFKYLATQNISSVLVEPGPTLFKALKRQQLIDELILYRSPKKLHEGLKIDL